MHDGAGRRGDGHVDRGREGRQGDRGGVDQRAGGRHAEGVALAAAGERGAASLVEVQRLGREMEVRHRRPYHAMLLVRTQEGLRDLYRAVTEAHLRQFYRVPRLYESQVQALRGGVALGAAGCLQGELWRAFLRGAPPGELREIAARYDYIELQPPAMTLPVAQGEGYLFAEEEVRRYAEQMLELADELAVPVVTWLRRGTLAEVLRDVTEIARAGLEASGTGEADEQAYAELVEYLRVAVQILYEELNRDGPASPDPQQPVTLH